MLLGDFNHEALLESLDLLVTASLRTGATDFGRPFTMDLSSMSLGESTIELSATLSNPAVTASHRIRATHIFLPLPWILTACRSGVTNHELF